MHIYLSIQWLHPRPIVVWYLFDSLQLLVSRGLEKLQIYSSLILNIIKSLNLVSTKLSLKITPFCWLLDRGFWQYATCCSTVLRWPEIFSDVRIIKRRIGSSLEIMTRKITKPIIIIHVIIVACQQAVFSWNLNRNILHLEIIWILYLFKYYVTKYKSIHL